MFLCDILLPSGVINDDDNEMGVTRKRDVVLARSTATVVKSHDALKKSRFVDEIGERYGEIEYRCGKIR